MKDGQKNMKRKNLAHECIFEKKKSDGGRN